MESKELEGISDGDDSFDPYNLEAEIPEQDEYTDGSYGDYITMQVMLPMYDGYGKANFVSRKRDVDGNPVGAINRNPFLESIFYTVEFDDGTLCKYAVTFIAESMYAQIDDEGREHLLMIKIIEHQRNNSAVKQEDGFINRGSKKIGIIPPRDVSYQ